MLIKAAYDVLNHHLGEIDKKGNKRLPDEFEHLKDSITKLVVKAYHSGKSSGKKEILEKIKHQTKELEDSTRVEIYESIEIIKDNNPIPNEDIGNNKT